MREQLEQQLNQPIIANTNHYYNYHSIDIITGDELNQ